MPSTTFKPNLTFPHHVKTFAFLLDFSLQSRLMLNRWVRYKVCACYISKTTWIWIPRTHPKTWLSICNLAPGSWDRQILGAYWSVGLIESTNSRFTERPARLNKQGGKWSRKTSHVDLWLSHTYESHLHVTSAYAHMSHMYAALHEYSYVNCTHKHM